MGDLVLLQDEVNRVISAGIENGLAVTALHNHFFFDEPKVYFMHIGGGRRSGQAGGRGESGNGINIVAIHHDMSGEEPRMLFVHYWGRGVATDLAKAVKEALAVTGK